MSFHRSRDYESKDDYRGYRTGRSISPPRRLDYPDRFHRDYTEPNLRMSSAYDASKEASFKSTVYDLESKISSREARIADLERQLRGCHDLEMDQEKTIKGLQDRLQALDREGSEYSAIHSKQELTISTLHSDNRQLQDRILELENRIRKHMEERDMTSHDALEVERNYEEVKHYLCKSLWPESYECRSHDILMKKLKDFADDYRGLKSESKKMEEHLARADDEVRKGRETIRKLLEDIDKTKNYVSATDMLKSERDTSKRQAEEAQKELQKMEDRLIQQRNEWEKAQYQLQEHYARMSEMDAKVKKHELHTAAFDHELRAFKETIATLLSDGYRSIPASEDAIKDKIRQLMQTRQDVGEVSKQLEDRLKQVSKQLEEQANLHKKAITRAKKAEEEVDAMKDRLKGAEGELVATDILKDGFKMDKENYLKFLEQIAKIMKMDAIAKDLGVEINGDALLARAEQLVKTEENGMGKVNAQSMGLQRQLREAKNELNAKTMHLDVLKKKVVTLEAENSNRAEHDFDDARKYSKQMEKLTQQLHEAKQTIKVMKKESVQNSALQLTCEEQRKHIIELERTLNELQDTRTKQAKKIAGLRHEKGQIEFESTHGLKVTESTIQSLSNEVQRLKKTLDDAQKREKQVLDLRVVIARMLGLDANTLAVPDYEIISRLEKLIAAQHEMALAYKTSGPGIPHSSSVGDTKSYMLEAQRRMRLRSGKEPVAGSRWK